MRQFSSSIWLKNSRDIHSSISSCSPVCTTSSVFFLCAPLLFTFYPHKVDFTFVTYAPIFRGTVSTYVSPGIPVRTDIPNKGYCQHRCHLQCDQEWHLDHLVRPRDRGTVHMWLQVSRVSDPYMTWWIHRDHGVPWLVQPLNPSSKCQEKRRKQHINTMDLLPLFSDMLTLDLSHLSGRQVVFFCDDMSVMISVVCGYTQDPHMVANYFFFLTITTLRLS